MPLESKSPRFTRNGKSFSYFSLRAKEKFCRICWSIDFSPFFWCRRTSLWTSDTKQSKYRFIFLVFAKRISEDADEKVYWSNFYKSNTKKVSLVRPPWLSSFFARLKNCTGCSNNFWNKTVNQRFSEAQKWKVS